jgi:hypothetical protein
MHIYKTLAIAAGALSVAAAVTPVSAAGTTRIETRPFYGAVVTMEEGVRVFRPLPLTERVIVNPHGATPLSLGFNETYVTERNYNYNHNELSDERSGSSDDDIVGYYPYRGFGRYLGRGHRNKGGVGGAPPFGGAHRGHGGGHRGGGR